MIKQCKGKDLNKVPKSKLLVDDYYVSLKYDGNYCQIHKVGDTVTVYSSGGKPIKLNDLEEYLVEHNKGVDFILEAEFIGLSEGKLGDRTQCGIMTTWRTLTSKGLPCNMLNNRFVVFDIIIEDMPFSERLDKLNELELPYNLTIANFEYPFSLYEAKDTATEFVNKGWEGLYLKHKNHLYRSGKRVNDAIKIKARPTADLLCIDVLEGEGKYEGMIGSLVLQNKFGVVVSVGSGLSDNDRLKNAGYFIDKVVEIEYEQILDTYIQPTFVRVREDKTEEGID